MGPITAVVLFVLSILAASTRIVARRPDAQKYIEMIRPYQAGIGFAGCFWGLFVILVEIWHLRLLDRAPVWWLSYVVAGALLAGLGFLMGYSLLSQHVLGRSPEMAKHGEAALAKLRPYQITLGYLGIAVAVWMLLVWLSGGVG
jgi:hypothetical protein